MNPVVSVVLALGLAGLSFFAYRRIGAAYGRRGGLALIALVLLAVNPLYRMAGVGYLQLVVNQHPAVAIDPYWDLYYTFAIFLTAAALVLSVYGGVGVLTGRRRSSVWRALIALWVSGPLVNALYLFIAGQVAALAAAPAPDFVLGMLPPLAVSLLATAYLLTAPQVRAVYADAAEAETPST
ncbi:hypothetical protein [Zoogloea sp. LCSB751]|uniref:hypothetical protein n=1 Tax=Zoogloea sp. LCSB751 TaxID=1965277 RepID=UPI0009A5079D|nr:hypothetical protein [Zoogloea sp. LCSB751]